MTWGAVGQDHRSEEGKCTALATTRQLRLSSKTTTQRDAWQEQIRLLKPILEPFRDRGSIYFEYAIPRLGKRIDVVVIIDAVIFVLEFKVGERDFAAHALDQVCDYALDLKNFHEASHACYIAPVLIATKARRRHAIVAMTMKSDGLLAPIASNTENLSDAVAAVLTFTAGGESRTC